MIELETFCLPYQPAGLLRRTPPRSSSCADDVLILVRGESSEQPGELPAYVIGQGEMVALAEREAWERALAERGSAPSTETVDRMALRDRAILPPGDSEPTGTPITFNRVGADQDEWTTDKAMERKRKRRRKQRQKQSDDDDSDSDDDDWLPSDDESGDLAAAVVHDAIEAALAEVAVEAQPTNLNVRGKHADDLLYLAPILQKATDAGVTQACMASTRLLHADVRQGDEALWASLSSAQRTPSFSADQQFHANEWAARERKLVELVTAREQRRGYLSKPNLNEAVRRSLEAQLKAIERELEAVFEEVFSLGIMHSVIYLQRSAFQIAPDLLGRLIFVSLPELERVKSHIMEVKEGYWLLVHLLFGRALVAWRALRSALCKEHALTAEQLRLRSRSFALWEFVMDDLVAPSVLLADGSRGRTISGSLTPQAAWPLVLVGLKRGLLLLLLSGRHHLYCDCFAREIRQLLLLSEDKFAWWVNNLWVRVGGSNFFNDETVERFLIKTLKRDMEGGHFTEREAARSAATVDALQMVREELSAMVGGRRAEKEDQASAEARHLVQRPGVPAVMLLTLNEVVLPLIKDELLIARQLQIIDLVSSYEASADPPSYESAEAPGPLAEELLLLNQATGLSRVADLTATLKAKLCNPFTGEDMENADVTVLRTEASDRLRRHVVGNYLNADKGFCYKEPPPLAKKEPPIVIGPPTRKEVAAGKKQLKQSQQSLWALGRAGVIMGPWDVAWPHVHMLFQKHENKKLLVWLPALNVGKAKAWPALVKVFGLKPWALGDGGSAGLPHLEGHTIRRNVLLSPDGSRELVFEAFGIDAFGDVRSMHQEPASEAGVHIGLKDIGEALKRRLLPLYRSGFSRGYYPFDAGDLNPYKWVTFYTRAIEPFSKLSSEEKARLQRAGGKLHESDFSLGENSVSLKAALLDKFFGGREAALIAIGEALGGKKLELAGLVPPGCLLTLHGVGRQPLRPLTVCVHASVEAPAGGQQATTRHAADRRPVAPKVEVSLGSASANAEGEDQLWRHAVEEASGGVNFLAYISDTDFKEASLVVMPRGLFPDDGSATITGSIMVASVDRGSPQTEPYWCLNELVVVVASSPLLCDGIPGDTPAAQRLRCAHIAAALILMGGDTTPLIHGLTEELGLKVAAEWAWYTGPVVEAYQHGGLEVFRLRPEAVLRLHRVWYIHRTTPNIQKELKFDAQRSREAQRAWLDEQSWERLTAAVLKRVSAPVGVPGQPVRSLANLQVVMALTNARLLQWGLAISPDEALFQAREALRALEGRQLGPWTTLIDWDLSATGKRRSQEGATTTPSPKVSAADLFAKYGNDLNGIDSLPSKPQNERLLLLKAQLLARGSSEEDLKGGWMPLKTRLLAALKAEAPAAVPAVAPAATDTAAPPAAAAAAAPPAADAMAETAGADVEMEEAAEAAEAEAEAEEAESEGEQAEEEAAEEEASSSDDDAEEEALPAHQRFFCCADPSSHGGAIWYCPGGCSHSFHNKCGAEAPELRDGTNKVCAPCYGQMMRAGRGARRAARE